MDEARLTRFITPSAFFLASLFFGKWLGDPNWLCGWLHGDKVEWPELIATIAGATTALFPLGFIITAVVTIFLRIIFCLRKKTYQISLSEPTWNKVWTKLDAQAVERTRANQVHAALIFDHEILNENVRAASVRLWTAFNIAAGSCGALVLAFLFGLSCLHVKFTYCWLLLSGSLFVLLFVVAVLTWRDHMGLLEFEANRIKALPAAKRNKD